MSCFASSRRVFVSGILACLLASSGFAQRGFLTTDSYGYSFLESGCATSFVDISATGAALTFTASGADPALDDGGSVLALQQPFDFYGVANNAVVVSTNGYIAAASTLVAEDGGDFSNDCDLPALPGNDAAVSARLMPFHDDLDGDDPAGDVFHEYFASCPRTSETIGTEACTVIQWHDFERDGASTPFDFEVILYHQSQQAVFLYSDLTGVSLDSVSVGLQNVTAEIGIAAKCNTQGSLSSNSARCLVDPRFPIGGPVADLLAELDNEQDSVRTGGTTRYILDVENYGPSPVTGASVSVPVVTGLESCSWSCTDSQNATCAAGTTAGALLDSPDLDPGGHLEYLFECTVSAGAVGPLEITGSATPPPGFSDPNSDNNTGSDSDPVLQTLFSDDFEGGSTSAWSSTH